MSISARLGRVVCCQASGSCSRASSSLPALPNRSLLGLGTPWAIRVEWTRFFQRRAVPDQVQAEAGLLSLCPHRGIGEPDLRHEREPGELGQHPAVDLVGLAGKRREPLHLVGIGDPHVPAGQLELVVDETRPVHRLDRR
jgi:hypothetical protein